MSYIAENIKEGIKIHCIETNKFKTNLLSVFLTVPLNRKNVTSNALIPAVLRRGTKYLVSQEEISKKLEEMYGATFDCGIDKTGDNQILKFYLETINDEFLPNGEQILDKAIDLLTDIVFNPLIENTCFKEAYVKSEKENLKKIIEAKIDNKDRYAYERCIEEMHKNETYGLYKYGYVEDLEKINSTNLFENYLQLIEKSKIDIFISGNIDEKEVIDYIKQKETIKKLDKRTDIHMMDSVASNKNNIEPNIIEEKMNVTQGKLVIGTNVDFNEENKKYKISLYNVILGEGANSKLFQNVREKEGLAYTTRSNYVRQKGNIYIRSGIEIENYEKAISVIKEQLEDMKNGNFSDEDLQNAKKYIISGLRTTMEEQDSEISYYFGQELSEKWTTFEEYEEQINKVTREDVVNVANGIKIDTVYFLRN